MKTWSYRLSQNSCINNDKFKEIQLSKQMDVKTMLAYQDVDWITKLLKTDL